MAYTTINKPTDYFNTSSVWSGNAGTQTISGIGHQPDFTWIKGVNIDSQHYIFDIVRGATKYLIGNGTNAEGTSATSLTSWNSDGFVSGSNDNLNGSGRTYVSWNWKAGGGQGSSNTDGSINTTYTSVNTTAGFSISKYTGTGSAATIGHGLGAVPAMIIVKNLSSGSRNWAVWHKNLSGNNKYLSLNENSAELTDSATWNNTAPTSTVFSSAGSGEVNQSGENFIAYCFAEKAGYSKFGSYIGNGNDDGSFIYTGFKPAFVMVKKTDSTGGWSMFDNKRFGYNPKNHRVLANVTDTEENDDKLDFLSNGFKWRVSQSTQNASGGSYIYMAFAEAPLVGSNGVTAKAR